MEMAKELSKKAADDLQIRLADIRLTNEFEIGTSGLKITSPYRLVQSNIQIPESLRAKITVMEVFEFEKNSSFDGMVTYTKYVPTVSPNLEGGVEGAISNARNLPGIEKVEEVGRKYYKNENYQWCIYELKAYRQSNVKIIKGATILSGLNNWGIFIILIDTDNVDSVNEIFQSIEKNE